ncbi:hypothetical protein EVAR_63164_1 [Eumeta japonica]|uniref:Uncharacterized protein n=1 Tax=Eumeta variegata TaxID=151549 RepID=A0A4C1Z4V9_EUMVA|nr:hypothetical protein EVAR_63164_1 [Eumeta japonica]
MWELTSSNKAMDNQTAIRMELNKIILLLAMQCIQKLISARQKRKRKIWVRDWISRRQNLEQVRNCLQKCE